MLKPSLPIGLYAITDPTLLPGKKLLSGVEQALRGGCQVIQYRDKAASEIERLRNAQSLKSLCLEYNARLIINDDLNLCLRAGADGVHLGKSDGDISAARRQLGIDKILGVTCHDNLDYAQSCMERGVDYCAFGRIFTSKTKPEAPQCPFEVLAKAQQLNIPSVAIGGINLSNYASLVNYELHNIAVINGLFGQVDIETTARTLSSFFKHSITFKTV